jgi:acetoin utilization protein AcuC
MCQVAARIMAGRIVLGGGSYNPWSVARCWAGVWGALNGHALPESLPAPIEIRHPML